MGISDVLFTYALFKIYGSFELMNNVEEECANLNTFLNEFIQVIFNLVGKSMYRSKEIWYYWMNIKNCCKISWAFVVYWPLTWLNMPFQRRRELHILLVSDGKRLRRRAWLTIWDWVKIPCTVTNWCTGRGWPVNCMTVVIVFNWNHFEMRLLNLRIDFFVYLLRGAADRGVESLRFQVSIVRR